MAATRFLLSAAAAISLAGVAHAQPAVDPSVPMVPSSRTADLGVARGGWTIVLASFRGEDQQIVAGDALGAIRAGGLTEAYSQVRGPATVLAIGRFDKPSDQAAKDELARVRALEIDGVRPFTTAFLAPPDATTDLGGKPEYNLLSAREQFGADALYTLQVGAYGPTDLNAPKPGELEEARRAAEQAASILRAEGELAFYYHGPTRSMVTIGVWGSKAFDEDLKMTDPTINAAQKRFPYNLYNGQGVKVKVGGAKTAALQKSGLVRVPNG